MPKKVTEARRRTAWEKVRALEQKADSVYAAGYHDWADRLDQQAFAIERDYGGFAEYREEARANRQRMADRAYYLDALFAMVMDPEVRQKHPRARAWASAAIDEVKNGGPLPGEGHGKPVTRQLRKRS